MKKGNRCDIHFNCSFSIKEHCTYFKILNKGSHICAFEGRYGSCENEEAQVSAMKRKIETLTTEGE